MPINDTTTPTANLFELALQGFKFLRRVARGPFTGQYLGVTARSRASHKLHAVRVEPRYVPKRKTPKGCIRIIYADPNNFLEYPNNLEGSEAARKKLAEWRETAKGAVPQSACAIPIGQSYKTFAAERAKAAADGSLYDKNKPASNMTAKKKPTLPAKKGTNKNKDQKNGITRPGEGTVTGKVWDIADKLGADRAAVIKEATKRGINIATITTQYGKWRVYNGLKGRTTAPKKPKKSAPKKKPSLPRKKAAPAAAEPAAAPAAE